MTPPADVLRELVLPKLDGVRKQGGYWIARCPAHEDRHPSLSVQAGTTQPVVLKCHAGCDPADVLAKLGLTWDDLCAPSQNGNGGPVVVAEYPYTDEHAEVLFVKERRFPKDFRTRCPDGRGGWTWKLGNTRRVLYRLPQLLAAVQAGCPVYVCEGEKDADCVAAAGAAATCNFDGAAREGQRRKVRAEYGDVLAGAHVVVVADDDPAGHAHARAWAQVLDGKAASVRLVKPATGKDAYDHLAAGKSLEDFLPLDDAQANAGRAASWEDPVPLAGHAATPRFPLGALPHWMGDMVRAAAKFYDTPPDVAAFAALGVVSVATSRRAWVNARGQREAVNAYLLTALDSGQRKSGPFAMLATSPILEAQSRLQADEDARAESAGEEPSKVRLFTTNATPAGLRELAAANRERVGIVSAEGGIFEELAGRYDRVPDLDLVLAGWNGEPYAADRATKPVPPMHSPVLTICLTAQPSILREMAHKPSFRDRGLLARFLYGLPADVVGKRRNERTQVPADMLMAYQAGMTALITRLYPEDRLEWSLSDAAYELFHAAEQEIEPKLARGAEYGGNDGMREWASKYMGQVLKLSGLLHAAEHVNSEHGAPKRISEQTVRNALKLGGYFIAHAEAAFGLMRMDPLAQDAGAVLEWVKGIDWTGNTGGKLGAGIASHPGVITRREVQTSVWAIQTVDQAGAVMHLLEKAGYVRLIEAERRDSHRYVLHPALIPSAVSAVAVSGGVSAGQVAKPTAETRTSALSAVSAVGGEVQRLQRTAETGTSAVVNPRSRAETGLEIPSAETAEEFGDDMWGGWPEGAAASPYPNPRDSMPQHRGTPPGRQP